MAKAEERKTYSGYQRLGIARDFVEAQLLMAKELDRFDDILVGGHGDLSSNLLFDTRSLTVKVIDLGVICLEIQANPWLYRSATTYINLLIV